MVNFLQDFHFGFHIKWLVLLSKSGEYKNSTSRRHKRSLFLGLAKPLYRHTHPWECHAAHKSRNPNTYKKGKAPKSEAAVRGNLGGAETKEGLG